MSILGVRQEFDIIGLDRGESHLFNEVLVNCVEPLCKEFCSLLGIVELGIVGVCCCTIDSFD